MQFPAAFWGCLSNSSSQWASTEPRKHSSHGAAQWLLSEGAPRRLEAEGINTSRPLVWGVLCNSRDQPEAENNTFILFSEIATLVEATRNLKNGVRSGTPPCYTRGQKHKMTLLPLALLPAPVYKERGPKQEEEDGKNWPCTFPTQIPQDKSVANPGGGGSLNQAWEGRVKESPIEFF